ncbi:MAG TPA: type II toxin-antitoxin system PemK/MazF family toxin [Rhizomicrobium sp.]
MNYASFDIVVVPFPYSDRLAEKRRPALVVSAPALQKRFGLIWLMMITSAGNPAWDCDVAISDLKLAGLPASSVVRPAKIATVDAARILRRIGKLTARDAKRVKEKLRELAAL